MKFVAFATVALLSLVIDVSLADSEPVKLSPRAVPKDVNLTTQCKDYFTPYIATSVIQAPWKVVNATATFDCAALTFSSVYLWDGFTPVASTKLKTNIQTSQGNIVKTFLMLTYINERGKYVIKDIPANFNYLPPNSVSNAYAAPAAFEAATLAGESTGYCLYLCAADPQYNSLTGLYVMSPDGNPTAISNYCMNNLFPEVPLTGLHAVPSNTCSV